MRGTTDIELDGVQYSCGQYSTSKAVKILAKLSKLIGKPIGILSAMNEEAQVTPELLGSAIEAFLAQVEPDDFVLMVKEILEGVHVNDGAQNRQVIFDVDFQGKVGHLLRLVRKVLEFQYADFFGDLATITGGAVAARRV